MEKEKVRQHKEFLKKRLAELETNWESAIYEFVPPEHRTLEEGKVRVTGKYILKLVDCEDFEQIMILMLKERGWNITKTTPGADGGLDAIGTRGAEKILLQAKHLKTNVGRSSLDALMGFALREKATHVVLASSSGFTQEVREVFKVLYHSDVNVNEGIKLPYELKLWGNTETSSFIDNLDDESFDQMVDPMKEKIFNRLK